MMVIELESEGERFRVWSEENGMYLLRNSTKTAVQNFFRQQAIMRADAAFVEMLREAIKEPRKPARQTKVVS